MRAFELLSLITFIFAAAVAAWAQQTTPIDEAATDLTIGSSIGTSSSPSGSAGVAPGVGAGAAASGTASGVSTGSNSPLLSNTPSGDLTNGLAPLAAGAGSLLLPMPLDTTSSNSPNSTANLGGASSGVIPGVAQPPFQLQPGFDSASQTGSGRSPATGNQ